MARREPTATESLMRIALGIALAIIFFGVLAVRGVSDIDEVTIWSVGAGAVVLTVGALGSIHTTFGKFLGHLVNLSLLGLFAIDGAIGLSALVPVGFWLFALIRGSQLDKLRPPEPEQPA